MFQGQYFSEDVRDIGFGRDIAKDERPSANLLAHEKTCGAKGAKRGTLLRARVYGRSAKPQNHWMLQNLAAAGGVELFLAIFGF